MPLPLDAFIPAPDVRERHSTAIEAPAHIVWATAEAFDFQSVTLIRGIIRLREILLRTSRVARTPQPFLQEAVGMGWGVLARTPGRLFVAGAECEPWRANVVFTPIPAADFPAWREPRRVKIAWTLEVEPLGPTSTRLATETRAVATDPEARQRFRQYWRWARFGIVAIRWLMLPAIRRKAEATWRAESTA
ncbi:MAG: hypothetical protein AB7I25_14055 [Vicinamibacterales bacterium]